ncbi:hypothetical protein Q3G72_016122 [Acer saccharum]|nr:hypothetical protein Q3G72_016122 [Acer saccharum]
MYAKSPQNHYQNFKFKKHTFYVKRNIGSLLESLYIESCTLCTTFSSISTSNSVTHPSYPLSTPAWITSKESPQRDTCRLPIGPLPLSSRPLFKSLISFSVPSRDRSLFTSFKRITY